MKRFVTYLYEYERGSKSKNVGFIRVNVRKEETDMQVSVRNCLKADAVGKVFALINKKNLLGIELGELKIINGQSDSCIVFSTDNIMDCGYSAHEIVGIGIQLQDGEYFASCWKDEFAEEIVRGVFLRKEGMQEENKNEEELLEEVSERIEVIEKESFLAAAEEKQEITYQKIDIAQIQELPSPNWHLATNSFLVHGFWNYGYLVLKKEMEGDEETLSLGVPGIFEKPEAVMAILFGFPDFQEVPSEKEKIEKNQEPKVGTFGCWFVNLKN